MIRPFPKPRGSKPILKPQRLPERKAVTIVAGFKSYQGVVICSDTQETVGVSKHNIPKLRFEPAEPEAVGQDELAVAFCGATDNGPFLDEIVDRAWEDAQAATSFDEACEEIKRSIKNSYKEFGRIYQRGYCPSAELIYGVKMHGYTKLFYGLGPAITERGNYAAGGQGIYMANFLSERLYQEHLSLRQCVILAAYVLFQCKEHVDGCGGDSHIAVLGDSGRSGRLYAGRVNALTELLKHGDQEVGRILMEYCDHSVSNIDFRSSARGIIESLVHMRESERLERINVEKFWLELFGKKLDDLGLPFPESKQKPTETDEDAAKDEKPDEVF